LYLRDGAGVTTNGSLANAGTLRVGDAGSLNGSVLTVNEDLSNSNFMQLGNGSVNGTVDVTGNATNSGTVDVYANSNLTVAGTQSNSGTVNLFGNNATLTAANLTNGGTINNNQFGGGVLDIGTSSGSAPGSLTMGSGATLTEDIRGTGPSQYGVINLSGPASLAGTLNAAPHSGFSFASGQTFNFLTGASGISGSFDTLSYDTNPLNPVSTSGANTLNIGNDLALKTTYSGGTATLSVISQATPTSDTWVGASGLWNGGAANAANWSTGENPLSTQDVTVGSNTAAGGTVNYNDANDTIKSLTVQSGVTPYTLDFGAGNSLTVSNGVTIDSGGRIDVQTSGASLGVNSALANNGGTLEIGGSGGTVTVAGLGNTGTIGLNPGGTLNFNGPGTYDNGVGGTIAMAGGTIAGVTGSESFTNEGTIGGNGSIENLALTNSGTVAPGGTLSITPSTGAGFINKGTVNVGGGDTLALTGGNAIYNQMSGSTRVDGQLLASVLNVNGGTLNGTGSITATVNNNSGTIHGGDSPGTLTINGNYTQGGGTLLAELAGPTSFDKLIISGTATLGGALDIMTDFTPVSGNPYDLVILDALGGLNGTQFTSYSGLSFAGGSWNVQYAADTVTLVAQYSGPPPPVPEPPTLLLLAFGVLLLAWSMRQKMRINR
ncbi:MAG: beta strand repeat-containing protein, partial [Syntrophobacteraceae bacterium]